MAVAVAKNLQLTVLENNSTAAPDVNVSSGGVLVHDQWNTQVKYDSTTTPAVSKTASFQAALSGGALTIDLTSLTGSNGGSVTFTTLKVVTARFQNPSTNANAIVIGKGAANGYTGFGATFLISVPPGGEYCVDLSTGGVTVDGTHKTLDMTGTAAQALNVSLTAG